MRSETCTQKEIAGADRRSDLPVHGQNSGRASAGLARGTDRGHATSLGLSVGSPSADGRTRTPCFRFGGFTVRAALYLRVSTLDQNPETQRQDLLTLAQQRGLEIVQEYVDHGVSGKRARGPALDRRMADATRHHFDVVLVWAGDRLARSVKHFLEVLDELNRLQIQFVSFRENLDTGGPLGRAVVISVSAVAELEKSLIVERVRAGLRRARPP